MNTFSNAQIGSGLDQPVSRIEQRQEDTSPTALAQSVLKSASHVELTGAIRSRTCYEPERVLDFDFQPRAVHELISGIGVNCINSSNRDPLLISAEQFCRFASTALRQLPTPTFKEGWISPEYRKVVANYIPAIASALFNERFGKEVAAEMPRFIWKSGSRLDTRENPQDAYPPGYGTTPDNKPAPELVRELKPSDIQRILDTRNTSFQFDDRATQMLAASLKELMEKNIKIDPWVFYVVALKAVDDAYGRVDNPLSDLPRKALGSEMMVRCAKTLEKRFGYAVEGLVKEWFLQSR